LPSAKFKIALVSARFSWMVSTGPRPLLRSSDGPAPRAVHWPSQMPGFDFLAARAALRGRLHLALPVEGATRAPVIVEGNGRTTLADRKRFFTIARGSALEVGAIFDFAAAMQWGDASHYIDAQVKVERIVRMVSKLR